MKGYFGIGVEGISKAMNVGTLFRTAHAFGASFVFTVRAQYNRREGGHGLRALFGHPRSPDAAARDVVRHHTEHQLHDAEGAHHRRRLGVQ